LEDSEHLAAELDDWLQGMCNDVLAEYRKFLEANGIKAITDHGWFTADAFEHQNMNGFASHSGAPVLKRTESIPTEIRIVFDGPPCPKAGRFVEVENSQGFSMKVGEWLERNDGYWELRIPNVSLA